MIKYFLSAFLIFPVTFFANYHSQYGQDKYINETFFKNYKNGVFLDVGAHNGITFSNTYFFEKNLGWKGLCLEPIPTVFSTLQKNRTCTCICGCAHNEHKVQKDFLRFKYRGHEMYSGLMEKFDPKRRAYIEMLMKRYKDYEIIKVNCYNLNHLLAEAKINHIHLFSLDTEGGELDILKNFDFSKCFVDVITVENNYNDPEFDAFLKSKGFECVARLKQDLVFVNQKSEWK